MHVKEKTREEVLRQKCVNLTTLSILELSNNKSLSSCLNKQSSLFFTIIHSSLTRLHVRANGATIKWIKFQLVPTTSCVCSSNVHHSTR